MGSRRGSPFDVTHGRYVLAHNVIPGKYHLGDVSLFRKFLNLVLVVGVLAACGGEVVEVSSTRFLGLGGACAPISRDGSIAVAPGVIELDEGDSLEEVTFLIGETSLEYTVGLAESGYLAGDLVVPVQDAVLIQGEKFDLSGAGEWTVVIIVEDRSLAGSLTLRGVEYQIDGQRLQSSDEPFTFSIAESCD